MPKLRHPSIEEGILAHESRQYVVKGFTFDCYDSRDVQRFVENEGCIEIGPSDPPETGESKKSTKKEK